MSQEAQKDVSYDLNGKPFNRPWFIFVLLFGSFTMSISQSSLSTVYPTFMRYFHISATTVQWLTTAFMLVMCIMMPVSPWLLNNIGFRTLFISVIVLFDIGSLIILFAPTFPIMMFGRILKAIAVGILFPSYQSVLLYITPKEKRGSTMGMAGLVMGSALAVGPIISGVVLKFTDWHGLFVFFIASATLILFLSFHAIKDVMPHKQSSLDYVSTFLLVGFAGILYVVNMIGKPNVNVGQAMLILAISIIFVAVFVYRQWTMKHPLLQLKVLKTFNYDLSVLLTGISYIALIVTTIVFPLYYQDILGVSPFISGMALVPGAAFLSFLNPLTGKLADRIGFKKTMLSGMSMIVLGWLLLSIIPGTPNIWIMIVLAMLIEGGNAFVMMPAVTLGANSLPKEVVADGTAVTTTARQILGSVGVAVSTLVLTNVARSQQASGVSAALANHNAYHVVFITMFILEVVGLCLAFMIRSTQNQTK
ncbi:multidrug efflux MFS transporter [Nicoliella spurrieriana]|uniref:Multidrug efflux MFS transporter n=1 Tax=Nicoliella spurrieriana TaxID=2925830 RepID=A0A976RR24_9LACO|nr:MDR family MFS transporter [Nicoliella spurrieriana]UQS86242.1 multidrug efflux MFS transporter [Nicoliella spurrieriana]